MDQWFIFVLLHVQYEVRLKTIALRLVGGKKQSWHYQERWIGDELGSRDHNKGANDFDKQVLTYDRICHDCECSMGLEVHVYGMGKVAPLPCIQ